MISERELKLVGQEQNHSDVYLTEHTPLGSQFAVFSDALIRAFTPDRVRLTSIPSASLAARKATEKDVPGQSPMTKSSNENGNNVDLSIITRMPHNTIASPDIAATPYLSITPVISLAPFLAKDHQSARVLVCNLMPDLIELNPSSIKNKLQRLKCVIDAFECQSVGVLFDEYDKQSVAAARTIKELLSSVGVSPSGIYTFEDGFASIAKKPHTFDTVICLSRRGRWIESSLIQTLGMRFGRTTTSWGDEEHGTTRIISGANHTNLDEVSIGSVVLGTILTLVEAGNAYAAAELFNAWLSVVEKGLHTQDEFHWSLVAQRVSSTAFIDAIIGAKGEKPRKIKGLTPSQHSERTLKPQLSLVK